MDTKPAPFVPPAPRPRTSPPSMLEMIRIVYRNPLELWGEPSYNEPWISVRGIGGPLVIANDPGLIRHVLVDNAKNYKLATVRQMILRPILRDGLLTAEGEVWKRSRKAMAPVFTPRHIFGFARPMLRRTLEFAERYENAAEPVDVARDMTTLTYDILAETLFSGEDRRRSGELRKGDRPPVRDHGPRRSARPPARARLAAAHHAAARPQDDGLFPRASWPNTVTMREQRMGRDPEGAPEDFLTLLLRAEGPDGLTRREIEDNIITFIGAGHETTARALGWTIYMLAEAPWERERIEAEIDASLSGEPDPVKWLDAMPFTRAAFEEAMRLYPPAPSINREPIEDDTYQDLVLPQRRPGAGDALDRAPAPQAVGPAGRLHAGAVPSRQPREDRPLPVPALRSRPARLHRLELRHAGGGNRAWRASVALPVRYGRGDKTVAGAETDDTAAGRPADAGDTALMHVAAGFRVAGSLRRLQPSCNDGDWRNPTRRLISPLRGRCPAGQRGAT